MTTEPVQSTNIPVVIIITNTVIAIHH